MEQSGCLYVVATPIGHLGDISARAIETLQKADWILCEDTRHSKPLLQHFGILSSLHALHRFNEAARFAWVEERLSKGEVGALISDAGTPGIQDPGQHLLNQIWQAGHRIVPIAGPCAAILALSVSGFVHDTFTFKGFLPPKQKARLHAIESLKTLSGPVILYETARRLPSSLQDLNDVLGPLPILLAREMTKKHETLWRTDLATAARDCQRHWTLKGELVLVLHLPEVAQVALSDQQRAVMKTLLATYPLSQVVEITTTLTALPRNACYEAALVLKGSGK